MILDSEFLGSLVDQDPAAREKARQLDRQTVPKHIPAAVLWETYTGIGNATDEQTATRLQERYQQLSTARSILQLTPEVARRAGILNGQHMASDERSTLDGVDSIVAAHGLARGEPVVSNDTDFRDVEGLSVVTY